MAPGSVPRRVGSSSTTGPSTTGPSTTGPSTTGPSTSMGT